MSKAADENAKEVAEAKAAQAGSSKSVNFGDAYIRAYDMDLDCNPMSRLPTGLTNKFVQHFPMSVDDYEARKKDSKKVEKNIPTYDQRRIYLTKALGYTTSQLDDAEGKAKRARVLRTINSRDTDAKQFVRESQRHARKIVLQNRIAGDVTWKSDKEKKHWANSKWEIICVQNSHSGMKRKALALAGGSGNFSGPPTKKARML